MFGWIEFSQYSPSSLNYKYNINATAPIRDKQPNYVKDCSSLLIRLSCQYIVYIADFVIFKHNSFIRRKMQ